MKLLQQISAQKCLYILIIPDYGYYIRLTYTEWDLISYFNNNLRLTSNLAENAVRKVLRIISDTQLFKEMPYMKLEPTLIQLISLLLVSRIINQLCWFRIHVHSINDSAQIKIC